MNALERDYWHVVNHCTTALKAPKQAHAVVERVDRECHLVEAAMAKAEPASTAWHLLRIYTKILGLVGVAAETLADPEGTRVAAKDFLECHIPELMGSVQSLALAAEQGGGASANAKSPLL